MKKYLLLALVLVATFSYLSEDAEAFLSYKDLRFSLDSNASLVNGTNTNFTYYYNLSNAPSTFWGNLSVNGEDILVTDSLDNVLSCQLNINISTQTGELYWRHNTSDATSTKYYVYFKNNTAINSTCNQTTTWDDQNLIVLNMKDDTTSRVNDSTSNGNNMAKRASNEPLEVNSTIFKAQRFDGVDDYGNVTNSSTIESLFGGTTMSLSFRINTSETAVTTTIYSKRDNANGFNLVFFNYPTAGDIKWYSGSGADADALDSIGANLNNSQSRRIDLIRNGTQLTMYIDGNNHTTRTRVAGTSTDTNLFLASTDGGAGSAWQGDQDYFRGTTNVLTANWIRTETNMEDNNSVFWMTGTVETANTGATITIYEPLNTTYFYLNNFNFTFKADDDSSAFYNLTAYLDGVLIYNNTNYTDNTNVTITQNLTQVKSYNFTVNATDNNGTTSQNSVIFTISAYNVSLIFDTPIYETDTVNVSVSYRINPDVISNITGNVTWNGTNEGLQDYYFSNSTHIILTDDIVVPLIQTNASVVDHNWTSTITFSNATSTSNLSSTGTQTVIFAYYFSANAQSQNDTSPIEGDYINNSVQLIYQKTTATFSGFSSFNNTNYNLSSANYSLLYSEIQMPTISATNETFTINASVNVSFMGSTRTIMTENDTVSVNKIILTTCGGISNTTTLNFFLKDEETDLDVNGTIEMFHNVSSGTTFREYNFTFANVTNATICINPAFATYTIDSWIKYYATGYSTRDYFLFQEISNVTSNITLYLLDETVSSLVIFIVRDESVNPITNAIIKIQRYFVGQNVYKTVAQCKSDDPDGKCVSPLRVNDVDYRYILEENFTVTMTTTPTKIVCQAPYADARISVETCAELYPQILKPRESQSALFLTLTDNFEHDCVFNETTSILRCDVIDVTGLMSASSLIVEQKGAVTWSNICYSNATSSAVTHTCNLGNTTGNLYRYQLLGYFSEPARVFEGGTLDFTTGIMNWGGIGVFIAMFFLIGSFFIFKDNPVISMAMGLGVTVLGFKIGMVSMTVTGIIGLAIATIAMIVAMKA